MPSGHEPVASLDEAAGRNRLGIHMQHVSTVDQMQKEDAPVSIRLVEAEVLEPEAKTSRVSLGGFRVRVGQVEVAALSRACGRARQDAVLEQSLAQYVVPSDVTSFAHQGLLPKVWDARSRNC